MWIDLGLLLWFHTADLRVPGPFSYKGCGERHRKVYVPSEDPEDVK